MRRSRPLIEAVESRLLMAIITVTNNLDSGAGSLRAAVTAAADHDTINLSNLTGIITAASTLTINKNLTLLGPVGGELTYQGDGLSRFIGLSIGNGKNVTLRHLSIANFTNGGVRVNSGAALGTVTLDRVTLRDNIANRGAGLYATNAVVVMNDTLVRDNLADVPTNGNNAYGGGVCVIDGALVAERSSFIGNTVRYASGVQAAISRIGGGAIAVYGQPRGANKLVNCTVVDNAVVSLSEASQFTATGGGVMIDTHNASAGSWALVNNTIADNFIGNPAGSGTGGGVYVDVTEATATLLNNVIARNTSTANADATTVSANTLIASHNLLGDAAGSGIVSNNGGNLAGTTVSPLDPVLSALVVRNGNLPTMGVLGNSPGAATGSATGAPALDARQLTRNAAIDRGALQQQPTIFTSGVPNLSSFNSGATFTYAITTTDADGEAAPLAAITKPAWMTLVDHGDGTATLAGTPSDDDFGTVTVKLGTAGGPAMPQTFTMNVSVEPVWIAPGGVLHVNGTDAANDIRVWKRPDGKIRVVVDGRIRNYEVAGIEAIEVRGFGGDDYLSVNAGLRGAYVSGHDGRDTVVGGDGYDVLTGGAGDDVIFGGTGDDRLNGNAGNDQLIGEAGTDRLYGGTGKDTLDGGTAVDYLFGDAGKDYFKTRDATRDFLYAGPTNDGDYATADLIDEVESAIARMA